MSVTWDEAVNDFVAELRSRKRRSSTIKSYRCHLHRLSELAPAGPGVLSVEQAARWSLSQSTTAVRVAQLFYGWLVSTGHLRTSPFPLRAKRSASRSRSLEHALVEVPADWHEPLERFAMHMRAKGLAGGTIALHLHYLRRLSADLPAPQLVTAEALTAWFADQTEWSPETRRSALASVRGFFKHAITAGLVPTSPATALGSVRIPRGTPRPTARDALSTALESADDRQRLMLMLGAYAGLRVREIAAVRPATDIVDGELYVIGKGGDERRIPLHPLITAEIAAELARREVGKLGSGFRYYAEVRPDGFLFPGQSGGHMEPGSVGRVLSRVLPERWTAHSLRHRFASQAYSNCRDIRAVQELLGHSSPVTTARYTAVTNSTKRSAVCAIT